MPGWKSQQEVLIALVVRLLAVDSTHPQHLSFGDQVPFSLEFGALIGPQGRLLVRGNVENPSTSYISLPALPFR
jgi:hypothetical protein